jgi:uncharacterized protein YciW
MTEEREYRLRVTRLPLDPVTRERMRENGTLPEDYRLREIAADRYARVTASSDAEARDKALAYVQEAGLTFMGETAKVEEVLPNMQYREIPEAT